MVDNVCLHQARTEAIQREIQSKKGDQVSGEEESKDGAAAERQDTTQEALKQRMQNLALNPVE